MPISHCTKCGTDTVRTDTDPGTYNYTCSVCGQVQEFVVADDDVTEISVCPICGKTHIGVQFFDYIKFVTNFSNLTAPFVASITGPVSGTVTWRFYDGETTVEQVGLSCSYQFTSSGPHNVHLICNLDEITALNCNTCGLTDIDGVGSCGRMTSLTAHTNASLVFDIDNLPSGLTYAYFYGCTLLTGVIDNLPSGLTVAYFDGCTPLTGVIDNLPSGLTYAYFYGCTLLTGVIDNLPSGLTVASFHGCTSLTGVIDNLPSGLTVASFLGCTSLTGVIDNLPSGLTYAYFYGCTLLTGVIDNLPSGLTYASFGGCSLLTGVIDNLPSGLTYAYFYGCTLLTGVIDNLPSGLTYASFGGCSLLTGYDIANFVNIGEMYLQDQLADLTRVNAIVDNVYQGSIVDDVFTDPTITLNIDGNNVAPSAAQITKILELIADYGWTISYTPAS